ncbi:hypothetical protein ES703_64213 [subsurface metagenome]
MKKKVLSVLLVLVLVLSFSLVTAVPVAANGLSEVWVDDDWQIGNPPYAEDTDEDNDFATIQAAIDAVDPSGTVNVAAGTYEEKVKIMDKSLTLLGAQTDIPIVDGERAEDESIIRGEVDWRGYPLWWCVIRIQHSDVVVNGFTIEKGKRGIAIQGRDEGISDIVVSYNYIKNNGRYSSDAGIFRDDSVVDITITHNYIASNPKGIATRGGATTITDNTFYGNGKGIDFLHGDPSSMYFEDCAEPNYPTLISDNTFTNDRTSIKLSLRGHQFITVTGNDITGARTVAIETSGWGLDLVNPVINYNNISDNEFGINNQVTEIPLNAINNWWGHASGPSGPGGRTNPDDVVIGKGDAVSDNVEWDPWLRRSVWTNPAGKDLPPGRR